jgi:hypothetical protein
MLTHRNRSVQRGRELNWPVAIQLTTRDLPSPLFRSQFQRSLAMDERSGKGGRGRGRVKWEGCPGVKLFPSSREA